MEVDVWYEWMFLWSYDIAQIVFVISSALLARKTGSYYLYACSIGFAMFFLGNYTMVNANRGMVDILYFPGHPLSELKIQYQIGRGVSSIGFLASSLSLFVYALKSRRLGS